MTSDILLLLLILVVTITLFIRETFRLDVTALGVVFALILTGLLTPQEALSGFGHPVVILIALLFVVGEVIFRTGIAFSAGNWLTRVSGSNPIRLTSLLMLVVAFLSAFMSSTGAIAIFIPIALNLAYKLQISPSKLLMPMSIAALIGGMMTLIGTPPNLIVSHQLEEAGYEPFAFFDFTPLGAIILLVGVIYTLLVFAKIKIKRSSQQRKARSAIRDILHRYDTENRLYTLKVSELSPLVSSSISTSKIRKRFGLIVIAVERVTNAKPQLSPCFSDTIIREDDTLYLFEERKPSPSLLKSQHVEYQHMSGGQVQKLKEVVGIAEVMLPPESPLTGITIRDYKFRDKHGLNVIAIKRGDNIIQQGALETQLQSGDVLLVDGDWDKIRQLLNQNRLFLLLTLPTEFEQVSPARHKAPLALGLMGLMLLLMTLNILPAVTAVMLVVLLMGATGCITANWAYNAIRWDALILIAGMLPLAIALEKTGATHLLVELLSQWLGNSGPVAVMTVLFIVTSLMSQFISNTATTVLLAPIAIGVAQNLGVSPYPFAMIVAIAASTAFSTPVASPVNTLVMAPGGYRFSDFAKVGIPLQIIILIICIFVLPIILPF